MRKLKKEEFLSWAKSHGMELDAEYPESAVLTFKPAIDHERFWMVPSDAEARPYFIFKLLELTGEWTSCFAWRHQGSWPESSNPNFPNSKIEYQILKGIGLPLGTADVVELDRLENDLLATLIFSTTIFGWSVNEDIVIVPNNGRYIIQTDHHGVIHVSFRFPENMTYFIEQMSKEGYPLPDHVPDETFAVPGWMKKKL